ncbi:MAG: hypothetical protein ABL883_01190 [Terricaulis sp.]
MIVSKSLTFSGAAPTRKIAFYEAPGPVLREFFLYRPSIERAGAPLVVSVHGIARNAPAHTYRLIEEAERYGLTVAAPLFAKEKYGQYQQLQDPRSGVRSDLALLDIIAAASRLSQASAQEVLLFGFSGGAQFAHRFVLAHPRRVRSAVLVAAGWYTFPDHAQRYPFGLDLSEAELDIGIDLRGALDVPQHVIVGELDIERDNSLRQSRRLDRVQGHTRLERAYRWVEAMGEFHRAGNGAAPTFLTLPDVGHSFTAAVERACLPRHVFDRFARDAGLKPLDQG